MSLTSTKQNNERHLKKEITMEQTDTRNGKISGSNFAQVAICPKSWQLSKGLPSADTEASLRGTKLHNLCEQLIHNPDTDLSGVKPDDVEAVQWCVERVRAIAEGSDIQTELRLWIEDIISGQIDVLIKEGSVATVVDYKFGAHAVEAAEHNFQLMIYALLVFENFPEIQQVSVQVLSPCVFGEKEPPAARYSRSTYRELLTRVKAVISLAESDNAPYAKSIGSHCQYCRARAICEKQKENCEYIGTTTALAPMTATITLQNAPIIAQRIKEWFARFAQAQKTVELIKASLIEFARANPDCGVELKAGAEKKEFDVKKTFGVCAELMTPEQFLACCKVSKTRLVEELANITGCSKKQADETLISLCDRNGAIVRSYNKPTLK